MNAITIKDYFIAANRNLTLGLVVVIIAVTAILWFFEVDLDQQSAALGLVLMTLAIVFYQIPRLAYRLTQKKFQTLTGPNKQIVEQNWPAFKIWMDRQSH